MRVKWNTGAFQINSNYLDTRDGHFSCLLRERVDGVIYRRMRCSIERRRKVSRVLTISWWRDATGSLSSIFARISAVRWTWRYFCPVDLSPAPRLILFFRHRPREQRAASPNDPEARYRSSTNSLFCDFRAKFLHAILFFSLTYVFIKFPSYYHE